MTKANTKNKKAETAKADTKKATKKVSNYIKDNNVKRLAIMDSKGIKRHMAVMYMVMLVIYDKIAIKADNVNADISASIIKAFASISMGYSYGDAKGNTKDAESNGNANYLKQVYKYLAGITQNASYNKWVATGMEKGTNNPALISALITYINEVDKCDKKILADAKNKFAKVKFADDIAKATFTANINALIDKAN